MSGTHIRAPRRFRCDITQPRRRQAVESSAACAVLSDVDSLESALQICRDFYPDEPISPRTLGVLRELFE
jgi:hypothetical protein